MKPTVYIPREVFRKIMFWIDKAPGEIGGMGTISYNAENNYFHVRDVYLLEQEVSSATTDLDAVSLGKLESELIKNKIEGDLNYWWHSHVNMGVFWSGTDTETIEQMGAQGYCVATVFNKKREMRSAVCSSVETYFGQKSTHMQDELPTQIWDKPISKETIAQWEKDYTDKVKEKKYETTNYHSGGYSSDDYWNGKEWAKRDKKGKETVPDIDDRKWRAPTAGMVRGILTEFRKTITPSMRILNDAEKHDIISAAACGKNLAYYNFANDHFSWRQHQELDGYVTAFKNNNPDFAWMD